MRPARGGWAIPRSARISPLRISTAAGILLRHRRRIRTGPREIAVKPMLRRRWRDHSRAARRHRTTRDQGLDPTVVSPAAKLVLRRFRVRVQARKSSHFLQNTHFVKSDGPASPHSERSPPSSRRFRPAKCQKCLPQWCLCSSKASCQGVFPKWRPVTRLLLEVNSRFVTFCTVLWTDHERPWRHAASSMVLRGRKPSFRMLIALQR